MTPPIPPQKRTYKWPWFVLGAFILGVVLAILGVTLELQRVRRIRESTAGQNFVLPRTNPPAPASSK